MVTIDLNIERQWDALFRRVEAGEVLRVVRGNKEVAVVQPTDCVAADESFLSVLAELGAQQIADTFPPDEYAQWEPKDGTR
jgi:predicted neuraminidase